MLKILSRIGECCEKRTARSTPILFSKSNIPGIVKCVDGTHIRIIAPVFDRDYHYNRKGFYSLNAMVVCDHKMRFRYVDTRYSGSNHDSHVWNVHGIDDIFDQRRLSHAPPGHPHKKLYSTQITRREIIERTTGVLKNRFRYVLGACQLQYTPVKAGQITNVCCILHNICIAFKMQNHVHEEPAE
ncbi:putative nuclease HARBI1 [Anopheles funestus]|uniref:putative nuclease HARBI1 n=1 Tax=Anopheles funestus TaxID=62324 RepID=UPI0020C717D5|nr:putative nuclease HARBI1 [Anopheles funestus]